MNKDELETVKERRLSDIMIEAIRLRGISVEKLSTLTGISEPFIEKLISEDFKKLPAAPYVRGYLLKIAEALNLDGERLWKEYLKDNESVNRSGKKDHLPPNRFAQKPLNKKVLAITLAAVLIIIYAAMRLPAILGKPSLTITNLTEDITHTDKPTFTALGKISPEDQLTINNEVVYPDETGTFQKEISLEPGFNTLEFKTKKLLGQTTSVIKQIFYDTPQTETSTP